VAVLIGAVVGAGGCGERAPKAGEAIAARVVLGEVGTSPGQFAMPRAMDVQVDVQAGDDDNGSGDSWLWIIDKSGRVQKIDPESGACAAWWRMPEIVLGKPTGITVGPASGPGVSQADRARDALWLADTHYHQILVYDPADTTLPEPGQEPREPRLIARFGSYGEGPGEFVYPTDVALKIDAGGRVERVYVSEYGGNDRITCLDGEFNVLFTFGGFGDSGSADRVEFNRPQAIGIDVARDELIVVDSCNHRVGRFTLDGELVAWIGSPETAGEGLGQFRYPWGLWLPGDGTALVVEQQGARVQHIDLGTGECLASWGRLGRGEGELVTPWTVGMIGRRAFVLDSGNNRVIGFDGPRVREVVGADRLAGGADRTRPLSHSHAGAAPQRMMSAGGERDGGSLGPMALDHGPAEDRSPGLQGATPGSRRGLYSQDSLDDTSPARGGGGGLASLRQEGGTRP
jgi:hypothetical protein